MSKEPTESRGIRMPKPTWKLVDQRAREANVEPSVWVREKITEILKDQLSVSG